MLTRKKTKRNCKVKTSSPISDRVVGFLGRTAGAITTGNYDKTLSVANRIRTGSIKKKNIFLVEMRNKIDTYYSDE